MLDGITSFQNQSFSSLSGEAAHHASLISNSASILICPSRHEPFGNIIIDGWAHKIPVIAANVSGPGNLIKERINGLKF